MARHYDVRTKLIKNCATVLYDYGDQKAVDWQPGNGTRYLLIFVELRDEIAGLANSWQVTWVHKRTTMFHSGAGFISYSYVMEKMGCNVSDAVCIAEAIGHVLGIPSTQSEEFSPDLNVTSIMTS